ncbi:hypothetical protein KXQ82_04250 [Mucilaginibacter sp. HMF5004]|uniref:hypothetical protein n=1 Tax=Mucilaginibacter rivuli TaxID=2857527 RepID=UPI001C5EAE66|nr:hypothetical protein [Mucilaginibacter rivuli]MBW4888908.1 hypothetical protein [Mucilaginibacter rivuli]
MLDQWLLPQPNSPLHRLFGSVDIIEITSPSDAIKSYIGTEIMESYRDWDYLKFNFEQQPEAELRKYINDYVLPSDKNQINKNVRQGDFAEVLSSMIVSFFQKRVVPLKKMRWKFNKDRSVFCTDMMAHNEGDTISDIFYYEIKSRLGIKKETVKDVSDYVTVHAHNSLLKDEQSPNEGIADFLSRFHFAAGDLAESTKFRDIVLNPTNYNKTFELFFIIETSEFDTAILDALENLPPSLKPLFVTIVLIKNLGDLVIEVQKKAIQRAVDFVYPQP